MERPQSRRPEQPSPPGRGKRWAGWLFALCTASLALATEPTRAGAQRSIETPLTAGDQLLFFYDARLGRVPFLSIANSSPSDVTVSIAFYPTDLASRLATEVLTIPARASRVVDPTLVAGGVIVGNAGLAVVTPVVGPSNQTPVVPPEPLLGGFTLANVTLGSAFGEAALGRYAVMLHGVRAQVGRVVDGKLVRFQQIAPHRLAVPVYFNPVQLAPPELDGNRVILAVFSDRWTKVTAGPETGTIRFDVVAATDRPLVYFSDAAGAPLIARRIDVSGVLVTNLQELSGDPSLLVGSGKVLIDVAAGQDNIIGLFSQSLGTFASGQRMPALPARERIP